MPSHQPYKLTAAQVKKEARKFKYYIIGSQFIIKSDNKLLLLILTIRLIRLLQCIWMQFMRNNYKVKHITVDLLL